MAKKVVLGKVDLDGVTDDFAWYTVITLFNNEEKYIDNVQCAVRGTPFEELIAEYFVPIRYQRTRTIVDGKVKVRTSKVKGCYSTYVFIKAKMTPDLWNLLRTIPGIAVVLTTGGQPVALSDEELERIRRDCTPVGFDPAELLEHELEQRERFVKLDSTSPRVVLDFNVGQHVETTGGSVVGLGGVVARISQQGVVVDFDGFTLTLAADQLRPAGENLIV